MSLHEFASDDWKDPFEIDTSVAHPARRYNYWLGGTDNFEADRISGDTWAASFPSIKIAAIENRRFLRRAVTYLVKEAGISQFLDIGTGIPAADNVHEVAQSIDPKARVVYVDNDPIVLAHARRLLDSKPGGATAYIHADLRDPESILDHPDLRATIDLNRPVALLLVAVLHFLGDGDDPYGAASTLTCALAPGSHLVLSHATADFMAPEVRAKVNTIDTPEGGIPTRDTFQFRDRAAIAQFFTGMEPIAPGIVPISQWRDDAPPGDRPTAADVSVYGAVARIG